MLKKTHLAIGLAVGLYFLPFVTHKLLFVPLILIASLLPDIDTASSSIGRKKIFRPIQMLFEHRGPLHSYSVCIPLSIILAFVYPTVALPFFLGYSFHLLADSFTIKGIMPFWPYKRVSSGVVKTGSVIDKTILYVFLVINLFLFVMLFLRG